MPYCDVCFVNGHVKVGADIYIDNTPKNETKLRREGLHTIFFANGINEDIKKPRAETWEEAYQIIEEKYGIKS